MAGLTHGTQRIRLLHVLDSLQLGGTEWQCVSLMRQLNSNRYQNRFVSLSGTGPLAERLTQADIACEVIPFRGFRHPKGVAGLARLAAYMRRHRIQIVQAYGFYSNVPAILAARMASVPIAVASRRDMGEFLSKWQRRAEKVIFRLADCVVVNSAAIRKELLASRQTSGDKMLLIPTGVDLKRFDEHGTPGYEAGRPEWAKKGKTVAMVAMFRTAKDHATFLRAARLILDEDPAASFVLAGGVFPGSELCQSLKDSAVRLAEELNMGSSVTFLGETDPERIPWLLQHVDVAVLASTNQEGLPNVVLEYMAAGKAVVVTDAGGCRELVQDGVTGFIVPTRSPAVLAEKILWLLRNATQAIEMGKAGRRLVEAEFSLGRMADRFSSLYESLARARLGRVPQGA